MMDMNRNVLWHDHERVSERQRRRMDFFWGDDSWRRAAYTTQRTLFGTDEAKADNVSVVEAYCERLRGVAGFGQVSRALPMRNTMGSVVYYLLLASSKPVAMKIITSIFDKYR
jgi:three-Cys-motif partner protein